VAGVRVGLLGGEFVVNPTVSQMAESRLDLVMAGTADAVLMIEGYCDFLSEAEMLQARAAALRGQHVCYRAPGNPRALARAARLWKRRPGLGAVLGCPRGMEHGARWQPLRGRRSAAA